MAVYSILVGVALAYPPRTHEYRKVMVEAPNLREAKLVAAQMAACSSTMPVSTELEFPSDVTPEDIAEEIWDLLHSELFPRLEPWD